MSTTPPRAYKRAGSRFALEAISRDRYSAIVENYTPENLGKIGKNR